MPFAESAAWPIEPPAENKNPSVATAPKTIFITILMCVLRSGNTHGGSASLNLRGSEFPALAIENNRQDDAGQRQSCTEFRSPQIREARVARLRIEKPLDKTIVARMQQHPGPDASRLQAHPRKNKTDAQDHHYKT